jgi:hypothetical protein
VSIATSRSVSGLPGSRSDRDFVWRFGSSTLVRNANNTGLDPVERFQFAPSDYSKKPTVTAELTIESFSGPLPTYMKFVVFGQVTQVSNLTANHQHHMVTQMLPKLP